jgi:uncharacterized cofD-like protein
MLFKLLTPGIRVKRWLVVLAIGIMALGLAFALALLQIFHLYPTLPLEYALRLGETPLWGWIALAGVGGVALVLVALFRLNKTLLSPLEVGGSELIEALIDQRVRARGPEIVAIGGGTGLPALLRGLKIYTTNLTAIITVADDGGSSGRLRRDLGVLPPGDFRNNIAALARDEDLITQLFQYRFGEGGLEGHSFGNLFITAMSAISGSFDQALVDTSRVLAIRGRVLPSTLNDVTLVGELRANGSTRRAVGESTITKTEGAIERVFLQPEGVPAYPDAVRAILAADLIVVGPGSLYTSILPNLLVGGIAEALGRARGLKIYVCNVATQPGETDGFDVLDHVRTLERHIGPGLFDFVLANDDFSRQGDASFTYVELPAMNGHEGPRAQIVTAPLADPQRPWRHDSARLAAALIELLGDADEADERPPTHPLT